MTEQITTGPEYGVIITLRIKHKNRKIIRNFLFSTRPSKEEIKEIRVITYRESPKLVEEIYGDMLWLCFQRI